ncbi:hypothetical protein [Micromonospora echinofusca]|uniref:hypothetical protein n=1 Tax=Micromonospora echinofusca TaxID=47858 RepID=UPI0033EBD450
MDRAPGNQIDVILTHPRHQQMLRTMIGLIADLRRCRLAADLYEFQEQLFRLVLEVEQRRSEISRVVKRLKKPGGRVPRDAPELGTELDPSDHDSWLLEAEVFERIWRQLKSIGDALAWRAFRYDRRIIVALSRNASPGLMYGKDGLAKERELIEGAWRDSRQFVLHHDLTAALRVGDLSVFRDDGSILLHEVKSNSNRRIKRQDQLLVDTSMVLAGEGALLPSGFTPIRTQIPLVTNMRGLREVLGLAHERTGIQGGVVSPGRAVVAASQYTATHHYREDTFGDRFSTELARCQRKIGMGLPGHTLTMTSIDSVARWPTRPPWAIYPVAPEVAASLTADAMFFFVCMSPDVIIDRLSNAGVRAEWMQPLDGSEEWTKPLLRVMSASGNRMLFTSLTPEAIAGLMLEFIDLRSWCRQVALMLTGDVPAGTRPWPCFTDEYKVWA